MRKQCTPSRERPNGLHTLESTIPCSNPIACVGDGFGTQYVTFSGSCEQHTSPAHWTTFDNLVPEQKVFQIAGNTEHLAGNISRYVDSLLDFLWVLMDDVLAEVNGVYFGSLPTIVETIASEYPSVSTPPNDGGYKSWRGNERSKLSSALGPSSKS